MRRWFYVPTAISSASSTTTGVWIAFSANLDAGSDSLE
jgi:hypothetical protein